MSGRFEGIERSGPTHAGHKSKACLKSESMPKEQQDADEERDYWKMRGEASSQCMSYPEATKKQESGSVRCRVRSQTKA
jgi:hypothetical protein